MVGSRNHQLPDTQLMLIFVLESLHSSSCGWPLHMNWHLENKHIVEVIGPARPVAFLLRQPSPFWFLSVNQGNLICASILSFNQLGFVISFIKHKMHLPDSYISIFAYVIL